MTYRSGPPGLPEPGAVPGHRGPRAGHHTVPDLATDTGRSENDGTQWSFTLKNGVTWGRRDAAGFATMLDPLGPMAEYGVEPTPDVVLTGRAADSEVAYLPLDVPMFAFLHGSKVTGYLNSRATNMYVDLGAIGVAWQAAAATTHDSHRARFRALGVTPVIGLQAAPHRYDRRAVASRRDETLGSTPTIAKACSASTAQPRQ